MNYPITVLVLMILAHLLADYPLQGWLAQSKAKSYWENADKKNRKDYIAALICHSAMWGILIFIPLIFWWNVEYYIGWVWLALPANVAMHAVVDDLKANKKAINLWQDQLIHLAQIVITWLIWLFAYYL